MKLDTIFFLKYSIHLKIEFLKPFALRFLYAANFHLKIGGIGKELQRIVLK